MFGTIAAVAACLVAQGGVAAPPTAVEGGRPRPLFREVMIPMRDGARSSTVIPVPTDRAGPPPILLARTPHGIPDEAPAAIPPSRIAPAILTADR